MIVHGLSVLEHKRMLAADLKDECNIEVAVERLRLRKKTCKTPSLIFLDHETFGAEIFINQASELCIEILEGIIHISIER